MNVKYIRSLYISFLPRSTSLRTTSSLKFSSRYLTQSPLIHKALELQEQAKELIGSGSYDQAELTLKTALNLSKKETSIDTQLLCQLHGNIGLTLLGQGKLNESVKHFEECSNYADKLPPTTQLATFYSNYAESLSSMKNLNRAIQFSKKAVSIMEEIETPKVNLAAALSNLAGYLYFDQQFDSAESVSRRALDIFAKNLGRDHKITQSALSNLTKIVNGAKGNNTAIEKLKQDWEESSKLEEKNIEEIALKNFDQTHLKQMEDSWARISLKLLDPRGFFVLPNITTNEEHLFEQYWKKN